MGQPAIVLQNVIVFCPLGDGDLLRDRENISQVFVRNIDQLLPVVYQPDIESISRRDKLDFPRFGMIKA